MAKHRKLITQPVGRQAPPPAQKLLTDQVYESLKESILRVEWSPGQMLGEPDLAQRYGVSKTPIREALRLLVQDGWVQVVPRKGYLIRSLGLEDVREVFALRQMLEPAMAADAARRTVSAASQAHLRDLVQQQREAQDELDVALLAARQFHLSIADLSGNSRAVRLLGGLLDEVRRLHHLMPQLENHITSTAEIEAHVLIMAALAKQDPEQAAAHMHDHLVEAARAMVGVFGGLNTHHYQ
jgi:DNA-binding GntR family transcriptional regulator